MKDPAAFNWCAERLKALADPERLRLITALLNGPKHVGTLADELAEPIVKVSHHLGVLRHADLVKTTKKGRFVEYALHPEVFLVTDPANENLIDLGCCRLDLGEPNDNPKKRRS
jgi:DNA-binding transcriptional ArsR family regulator